MVGEHRLTRRSVLKRGTALAGSVAALPLFNILPGGVSPNEKLNVAFIGMGNRNCYMACKFFGSDECLPHLNYVAFCEPDLKQQRSAAHMSWGKPHHEEVKRRFPDVPWHTDYRKMLDARDAEIDAVIIAAKHDVNWSAAMWAMAAGKHVYHEKPTGVCVEQARLLRAGAERYSAVTQMGNPGMSSPVPRTLRNWVEAGVLGELQEIHKGVWGCRNHPAPEGGSEPPDWIDWDAWLSTAPMRPFRSALVYWGQLAEFALGIGWDFAIHHIAELVHAFELRDPTSVRLLEMGEQAAFGSTPEQCVVEWRFPARGKFGPCRFVAYSGSDECKREVMPLPPETEKGRVGRLNYKNLTVYVGSEASAISEGGGSFRVVPETKMRERMPLVKNAPKVRMSSREQNHFLNWIEACKAGDPEAASSRADRSGAAMEMMLLGITAARAGKVGKELMWDAESMRFTNDQDANGLLRRPYREEFVNWDVR